MNLDFLQPWVPAIAVATGAVVLGYAAKALALSRVMALAASTKTDLDDLVIRATRRHVPLWLLLGGIAISARLAPVSAEHIHAIGRAVSATFMLSLSLASATFFTGLVNRTTRRAGASVGTTSLAQNVIRGGILLVGALLVLSNLGVEITPLLTALGIGSLAVALALQPTLSNLFAGLHLAVSRPIQVGDFVEIEGNTTGYVTDIGWRATRIRELANNVIVVPNARLAEMVVKNYALPEPEQTALVQVGVSYGSDLERVEKITCDVAREVLREVQGGVAEFEPFIRYNGFGDSSINFTVILRVRQYVDRFLVTHEFIKRLKARYDREGIAIPFPQRVLHGTLRTITRRPQRRAYAQHEVEKGERT